MRKLFIKEWRLLSQRQRMSPFPNYLSMESMCGELRHHFGFRLSEIILIFQDRLMNGFLPAAERDKTGCFLVKKLGKNPKLFAQAVKKQEKFGQTLVDFTKKANRTLSAKTSSRGLYKLFADYEKKYKNVYATYGVVWLVEDVLMGELLKIVEKRIADPKRAVEMLNVLTKQPSAMVATIERRALLELSLKIAENDEWKNLIIQNDSPAIKQDAGLSKLISEHVKKYFWVTRDYEDAVLTETAVIKRLAEHLRQNLRREYDTLTGELKDNEKRKKQYRQELKLSKSELNLFSAMLDVAHLKELRKRYVSESLYYFDKILEEIGRRTYLSIKQTRFLRTKDIQAALLGGKDLTEEANARIKFSVWHSRPGGKTEVITGKEAEMIFNDFVKVNKNAAEFHGLPVSPGIAKGPARIVMNPDECGKVRKGDIIVSVQVVPSFSTAIIKAAGLVCDGGHGITSHAATLARESGIPCVIQTRFAREALKDGETVEVDGYSGAVRRL